jgi:hypothetical protein
VLEGTPEVVRLALLWAATQAAARPLWPPDAISKEMFSAQEAADAAYREACLKAQVLLSCLSILVPCRSACRPRHPRHPSVYTLLSAFELSVCLIVSFAACLARQPASSAVMTEVHLTIQALRTCADTQLRCASVTYRAFSSLGCTIATR